MRRAARLVAFSVALIAIVVAIGSVVRSISGPASGGGSIGLCGLSSPDDLLVRLYLDANAGELEQPAGADETPVTFVVEPGETAAQIGSRLEQEGLISDGELFRRYVQVHGLDAGVEAGQFTLRQTMTIPEVAQVLQKGELPEPVVTVQEGLRLEQVVTVVAQQTTVPQEEFLALVTWAWRDLDLGFDFLVDVPPGATLEGFLFPETYRLPEEPTALDLLNRMLETFDARVTPEIRAAAADRGLNACELVSLASIVEREAVVAEERPLIAGVYLNRLKGGWRLHADPTVQYAIAPRDDTGEWWPVLTLDDLEFDSPYNTYRNPGLPPGPICSPGLASIQATAYPAETDYYFFLADCTKNDGSHLFAVTEEEHFRNFQTCGGGAP